MAQQTATDKNTDIVKRLNVVITLLMEFVKEGQSTREKIKMLSEAGLDYREIASILNKDKSYVAVELSTIKNKIKKNREILTENV